MNQTIAQTATGETCVKAHPALIVLLVAYVGVAAASDSVRIMPLGDSITQGDVEHSSYRRPLWQKLQAAGYEADFVGSQRSNHRGPPPKTGFDHDHEGHWGWRIDEVLPHATEWVAAAQPDIVLIHLGTNDLYQGQPVEETAREMRRLVKAVRIGTPPPTVLVSALHPLDPERVEKARTINDRIRAFNKELEGLADTLADGVAFVPLRTEFSAARHTYDGVHPTAEGERMLARAWFEVLAARMDTRR